MSPQVSFESRPRVAVVGMNRKSTTTLAKQLEEMGLAVLRNVGITGIQDEVTLLVMEITSTSPGMTNLIEQLQNDPALGELPKLGAFALESLNGYEPGEPFDDFVVIPCHSAELCARVRRLLSRAQESSSEDEVVRMGHLVIDPARYDVTLQGKRIVLTHMEFQLLKYLVCNRGRVISRERLFREVWEQEHPGGMRTVDVHIRRLRAKLGPDFEQHLQTVRKVGYRLAD